MAMDINMNTNAKANMHTNKDISEGYRIAPVSDKETFFPI
jgi:hypothetical protein